MNYFHHKDLGNHLLQVCPKVVKHSVLPTVWPSCYLRPWSVCELCGDVTQLKYFVRELTINVDSEEGRLRLCTLVLRIAGPTVTGLVFAGKI